MGRLILSVGKNIGWSVYHKDKVSPIISGYRAYRNLNDFYIFFKTILSDYTPIENIFAQVTSYKYDYIYLNVKECLKNEYELNRKFSFWVNARDICSSYTNIKLENSNYKKIMGYVEKKLGHFPDNIEEACAIITNYYLKDIT
jgi:hypothetical protein